MLWLPIDVLRYELALAALVAVVIGPWVLVVQSNPGQNMLIYGWLLGFYSLVALAIGSPLALKVLMSTSRAIHRQGFNKGS